MSYSENTTVLSQSLPEHSETFTSQTKVTTNSVYSPHQTFKSHQQKNLIQNNINVGKFVGLDKYVI